ncbi:extensin [Iris pallida]|uniref:Extensin n=1 Tax=Iris pallida TaxID=29817 RepID=A0AAX6H2W9_IRIPA|nr:extensin [Iris pallida]
MRWRQGRLSGPSGGRRRSWKDDRAAGDGRGAGEAVRSCAARTRAELGSEGGGGARRCMADAGRRGAVSGPAVLCSPGRLRCGFSPSSFLVWSLRTARVVVLLLVVGDVLAGVGFWG